jgi:hypothetical protein
MAVAAGLVARLADVDLQDLDPGRAERPQPVLGQGDSKRRLPASGRDRLELRPGVSQGVMLV